MTEKSGVLLIKEDISMYYFKDNGTVDLYADGSPVITGLTPWMNPTLGGRVYLKAVSVSETEACFSDDENISSLILSIKERDGCFAVCANGSYNPRGTHGHGTHLDDLCDIGLTDKYITTATFEKSKETITVLDSGEFAVYSENELKGFDTLASNLYVKPVKKGETL